jgi:hypothetical protein
MDILIEDTQTGTNLYGHALLKDIKRTGRSRPVQVIQIPAEAWVAFLQIRYSHVPEVKAYLKAAEKEETINPQAGKLLEAVDEALDLPEEEVEALVELVKQSPPPDEEGESWKKG